MLLRHRRFVGTARPRRLYEVGIAGRMVAMPVRVDQETDRLGADFPNRSDYLVGYLCILGIHHEEAIRTCQHADPAAGGVLMARIGSSRTGQNIKVRSDLFCQDLDFGEVTVDTSTRENRLASSTGFSFLRIISDSAPVDILLVAFYHHLECLLKGGTAGHEAAEGYV
jgi:hypothetical protein